MADRKITLMNKEKYREPLSPLSSNSIPRTPRRTKIRGSNSKTPSGKTPSGKTPSGISSEGVTYDRFISNRALMDNDIAHHLMFKQETEKDGINDGEKENDEFSEHMEKNLNGEIEQLGSRILRFKLKAPECKESDMGMKMLYTKCKPTPAKFKSTRHVPSVPDKILDAPEIVDDYYLNVLDWGKNDLIAVPLYNAVYIWNSATGDVEELFSESVPVTSVKWITEGYCLAVGLSDGTVELWDTDCSRRIRAMSGHGTRVGSLDWNEHFLTSGAKSGKIFNHDVRVAQHHCSSYLNHSQEICGLQWSNDGKYLASGGNDNTLNIWDGAAMSSATNVTPHETSTPLYSLLDHTAAVKAVSWCPWQRNTLASGGGTLDRHIRTWNVNTGACLQSFDTNAQISGILWSAEFQEIICSHSDKMTIYKYPKMRKEAELSGHTGRILNITMSPDGHFVASAGADETLRLWKCFEPDKKKKIVQSKSKSNSAVSRNTIR